MLTDGVMDVSGTIPLELPNGKYADARIQIKETGRITITFSDVELANIFVIEELQNRLVALGLHYVAATPAKREEPSVRE